MSLKNTLSEEELTKKPRKKAKEKVSIRLSSGPSVMNGLCGAARNKRPGTKTGKPWLSDDKAT